MDTIPIAQKKEFIKETDSKGRFIIEPLYPGYGLTLGNALRRVLLSSLEGVAITFIRLKAVDHEFSTLPGVKEDVVDIILNLKQARFEVSGEFEEPIKLELKVKGAKEVKVKDFKKVAGVKIASPDLIIATLTEAKANFELEVWLERGRGYLPTEMMKTKEKEVGMLAIDAIFSPIKKVAIDTENVRVGEMTNWDRLLLDLETDGTILPEEAFKKAVQILVEQFSFFLEDKKAQKTQKAQKTRETQDEIKEDGDKSAAEIKVEEVADEEVKGEAEEEEESGAEKPKKKRGRPKKNE